LDDLISSFRASIDEQDVKKKFPLISEDETPIWMGTPSFLSFTPRYLLAFFVFLIHFSFYLVAITDAAQGEDGYLSFIIRFLDILFDAVDVFAFVFVMLIFARLNFYLNVSTSTPQTTIYLLLIGLIPSIWFVINIIDWFLYLVGQETLSIPEWLDTWFLVLGIVNGLILFISSLISQQSFSYLMTDQKLHFRKRNFIFYKSYNTIDFDELENIKTNQTILGKIFRFGDILPIIVHAPEIDSQTSTERSLPQKFFQIIKLLMFHKRQRKTILSPPSKCFFGIKSHMNLYELANELIDAKNGRPDLTVEND
tara:strand:+ start:11702 stop:12631 length:930 start_codon:yes stop_codon:yes gene_type:complete